MTCDCRLWNEPDGLACTVTGPHRTHVYASSTASHLGEGLHHLEPNGDDQ